MYKTATLTFVVLLSTGLIASEPNEKKEHSLNDLLIEEHSELIQEFKWENKREGMSLKTARQICNQIKETESPNYFQTYCRFTQKIWTETYIEDCHYYSDAYWRIGYGDYCRWNYYSDSVWELEVFGLGPVEELVEKTLFTSKAIPLSNDRKISVTFDTFAEAFLECIALLKDKRKETPLTFHKATCEVQEMDIPEERFHFLITTLNPLLEAE